MRVRRPALHGRTVDAVAGVVLTATTQYEVWTTAGVTPPLVAQAAYFAAATLVVTVRRVAPLPAVVIAAAALAVQTALLGDAPVVGGFLAVLLLTYTVAAHDRIRPALAGLAVVAAAVSVEPLVDPASRSVADAVGNAAVFGLLWGAGRLVRLLRRRGASAERRADDLVRSGEEQVRAAVAEERQRIARELHDVVAHSVSVMVLQAGAARQQLDREPERAREPLHVVEEVGREALEELQRLLRVLRRSDEAHDALVGLGDLDPLLEQVRRAGTRVELCVAGTTRRLAPGLDLTAYRVLQEALTNVLKHAPTARAEVTITYRDRSLDLAVVDDGGGGPNPAAPSGGHGLIGMRERVLVYGGTLRAAARPEGGFSVAVVLPLAPAVRPA